MRESERFALTLIFLVALLLYWMRYPGVGSPMPIGPSVSTGDTGAKK
jgi:hypothetical protein